MLQISGGPGGIRTLNMFDRRFFRSNYELRSPHSLVEELLLNYAGGYPVDGVRYYKLLAESISYWLGMTCA
jgi:hypothetical protein